METVLVVLPAVVAVVAVYVAAKLLVRYEQRHGPECWEVVSGNRRIRLENTWFDGARLYVDAAAGREQSTDLLHERAPRSADP